MLWRSQPRHHYRVPRDNSLLATTAAVEEGYLVGPTTLLNTQRESIERLSGILQRCRDPSYRTTELPSALCHLASSAYHRAHIHPSATAGSLPSVSWPTSSSIPSIAAI